MPKKKVEELTIEEKLNNALIPVDKQPYKIPQNWCWVRLESVINLYRGVSYGKNDGHKKKEQDDVLILRGGNLGEGYIQTETDNVYVNKKLVTPIQIVKKHDVLIVSSTGSSTVIGKAGISHIDYSDVAFGAFLMLARPKEYFNKSYIDYFFLTNIYRHRIRLLANGTNINNVRVEHINGTTFPLPPLAEQERIVNKLDNYISKLDEAKEKLEKVVDTFEYRKSIIIHKAFNGEFTKQWRKENNISFNSWEKNKLSNLCVINPPKNIKNINDNTLVSVVPMSNVSEDGYVMEYLTKEIKDVQKGLTNFIEGDVVFAKITPCMENGKSAIIGKLVNDIGFGTTEFYVFRCNDKLYNKYLHYLFRDKKFRINAKYYMRGSVGQQRLPKQYLENYILNLPPLEEQKEIVKILDSVLSKEKQVKEIAEKEIERVDDLKKNLLTRAFGGLLGTNDPNEENSIELLKTVL